MLTTNGFGGSGCPIELDDPNYDGLAASQLITFLGGGWPPPTGTRVDYVAHDAVAHDGRHHAFDPRVGMIGGSYGGEVQFAAAEQDPRLDTIIPIITLERPELLAGPQQRQPTAPGPQPQRHQQCARGGEVHLAERLLRRGRGR